MMLSGFRGFDDWNRRRLLGQAMLAGPRLRARVTRCLA